MPRRDGPPRSQAVQSLKLPPGKEALLRKQLNYLAGRSSESKTQALAAKSAARLRLGPRAIGSKSSPGPEPVPPEPVTSLPSGIFTHPQPPFPSDWFSATTVWSGDANGTWWWVFSGSVGVDQPNAGQGGVVVLDEPDTAAATGPTTQSGPYFPVSSVITGPLQITGETAGELTLSDSTGATFTFNLATLTFS